MFTVKIIMHAYKNWQLTDLLSQKFYSCKSFEVDNESKTLICKKDEDTILISLTDPEFDGSGEIKSVYVENESGKTVYAFHGADFVRDLKAHIDAKQGFEDALSEIEGE